MLHDYNYTDWPEKLDLDEYAYLTEFVIGYLLNKADTESAIKWLLFFIDKGYFLLLPKGHDNNNLYQTLLNTIYSVRNISRGSRIVSDIFTSHNNEHMKKLVSDENMFLGVNIHYIDNNQFSIDNNELIVLCKSKIPVISYRDLVFRVDFEEKTV